jgi:hypothetical protein
MHVDRIPNRTSPPAYLLRESYRDGNKVRKRTLANITHWPLAKIEALRRLLRDELPDGDQAQGLSLLRSLPHGHVAAGHAGQAWARSRAVAERPAAGT